MNRLSRGKPLSKHKHSRRSSGHWVISVRTIVPAAAMLSQILAFVPAHARTPSPASITAATCANRSTLTPDTDPVSGTAPGFRTIQSVVYDTPRERLILFGGEGGAGNFNDVWSASLGASPAWTQLTPTGTPPSPRGGHSAMFDAPRDRMLVFGGGTNELLALSLSGAPAWSLLAPTGTVPNARTNQKTVFDPVRNRMWLFGGDYVNDLYYLELGGTPNWVQVSAAGTLPEGRGNHAMVYDSARDRIVVFGGGPDGPDLNDLWQLSLSGTPTWIQLSPAGTPPATGSNGSGVYDPAGDQLIFGGPGGFFRLPFGATSTWSPIAADPPLSARSWPGLLWDSANARLIVSGGFDTDPHNDVLSLSFTSGFALEITAAPPLGGNVVSDPSTNCHTPGSSVTLTASAASGFAFNGWSGDASGTTNPLTIVIDSATTIVANFIITTPECGWTTLVPIRDPSGGAAPYGRIAHSAIVDSPRERLVIFGGDGDEGGPAYQTKNDLWSLSLDDSLLWTELHPTGTLPQKRRAHTAVFDAPRDRMIVFGGIGFDAGRSAFWPDDSAAVWSLSLTGTPAWSVLQTPQALLSRRFAHATALDPTRARMWVYGGSDELGSANFSPHLYYLDLAATPQWVGVAPAGSAPPGLVEHVLVYDSLRDRLLLFGGSRAFTVTPMQDVWQLNLSGTPTWSQLAVLGNPPQTTTNIRGIYDPLGDQLIVEGPTGVQALALAGTPTWRPIRAHTTRYATALAYDSAGVRVLAMGGESGPFFLNDVLELSPAPTVRWSVTPGDAGSVAVDYHDDCPETVTLTAVPVHGFDFNGWTGDVTSSTNPITIPLDAQKSVVATFSVSTATLISRFVATRTDAGIELRWGFGDPARVSSTTVDRRRVGDTSWQSLALTIRADGGAEVALDAEASAGLEYDYRLRVILYTGEEIVVGPIRASEAQPLSTTIESVSPNPSPGPMTIGFTLAQRGAASLTVLDVTGRQVTSLLSGDQAPGRYQVAWDGAANGRRLPAGLYFARLSGAGRVIVRKLVLAH